MADNRRKDAFKKLIMEALADDTTREGRTRDELVAYAQKQQPDLFDDEACYPKCQSHKHLWQHQFERSIYDLRQLHPPKVYSAEGRRGIYYKA